jgi:hypothetical protein
MISVGDLTCFPSKHTMLRVNFPHSPADSWEPHHMNFLISWKEHIAPFPVSRQVRRSTVTSNHPCYQALDIFGKIALKEEMNYTFIFIAKATSLTHPDPHQFALQNIEAILFCTIVFHTFTHYGLFFSFFVIIQYLDHASFIFVRIS